MTKFLVFKVFQVGWEPCTRFLKHSAMYIALLAVQRKICCFVLGMNYFILNNSIK